MQHSPWGERSVLGRSVHSKPLLSLAKLFQMRAGGGGRGGREREGEREREIYIYIYI